MKVVLALLCLALSLQWGAGYPAAFAMGRIPQQESIAQPDLSTPQKTIEVFFAALNRADLRAMVPCVLDAAATPELEWLQKEWAGNPMPKLSLADFKVYKDEAGTECAVLFGVETQADLGGKTEDVMIVRKTDDGWKIVAPKPGALTSANALRALSVANTLVIMIRYPEVVRKARNSARSAVSLSNVKQICLGLLMYTQDYDEVLVPDAAKYKEAVFPYVKNESVFTSPLDPPGTLSYKFNPQLSRKSMAVVSQPANTVMIFEGEYKKLLFRYDGKAVVGFADGHVKFVTPEEAKKLRWTP